MFRKLTFTKKKLKRNTEHNETAAISRLPNNLLQNISSHLNPEDVAAFSSVAKLTHNADLITHLEIIPKLISTISKKIKNIQHTSLVKHKWNWNRSFISLVKNTHILSIHLNFNSSSHKNTCSFVIYEKLHTERGTQYVFTDETKQLIQTSVNKHTPSSSVTTETNIDIDPDPEYLEYYFYEIYNGRPILHDGNLITLIGGRGTSYTQWDFYKDNDQCIKCLAYILCAFAKQGFVQLPYSKKEKWPHKQIRLPLNLSSLWSEMKAFDMDSIRSTRSTQEPNSLHINQPPNHEAIRKSRLKITQGHRGKPLLKTSEAKSLLKQQNNVLNKVLEGERARNLTVLQRHDAIYPRQPVVNREDAAGGGRDILRLFAEDGFNADDDVSDSTMKSLYSRVQTVQTSVNAKLVTIGNREWLTPTFNDPTFRLDRLPPSAQQPGDRARTGVPENKNMRHKIINSSDGILPTSAAQALLAKALLDKSVKIRRATNLQKLAEAGSTSAFGGKRCSQQF